MARKTRKLKPKEIKSILGWAGEAIADRSEARVWADEAVAYAELALEFPSRERESILLTREARLALIECESHASRAKSRRWAVESVAPPHRREGVEEVVEFVGRAATDALDHARRAKEAVTRARRGREALAAQEAEERVRRAYERRQKASRDRARAEWERDRAELREHAERLRS